MTQAGTASSRSASDSTITAELLPSSNVTRFRPAISRSRIPTSGLPVNVIIATSGCVGPSVAVVDQSMVKTLTTKTIDKDIYAFIFSQKGLTAGLGLQGTKITRIDPK